MPGQGLLSTPESSSAPRGALAVLYPRLRLKQAWAQKTPSLCLGLSGVGGPKRIRTAVAAFAELSLATRPSDPFPGDGITVGLRIYESGFRKVSLLGDKFRKDAYNAGDEGLMGWVRFAT